MPDITNPAARSEVRIQPDILRVTRQSMFTGKVHTMDLPLTVEQERAWRGRGRTPIDRVLPHMTSGQREFLLTGCTEEEWDAVFPPEDDDE